MTDFVGNFIQESREMIVSDPCYKFKDSDGGQIILNVRRGVWKAFISQEYDDANSELIARFSSFKPSQLCWECVGKITVDSGQAGIYDCKYFRSDSSVKNFKTSGFKINDIGDLWYDVNSTITLSSEEGAGTITYGCVSDTAYGDGEFFVYVQRDRKERVLAIKISFIEPLDEDMQEDDDEE